MFNDPNWLWLEILVIALLVVFFATLIIVYIYKKVHHMPTGECACCQAKSKKMLKQYHKMYSKKGESK